MKKCPRCKIKNLPGHYGTPGVSLSRLDNKTEICSTCGIDEALHNMVGKPLPPKSSWPVNTGHVEKAIKG